MTVSSATTTSAFSIDEFVKNAKSAIHGADGLDKQQDAVKAIMEQLYREHTTEELVDTFNSAVPEGANLAEMILYADDDVTLLWGQIPPRFQSAVHNHTIWANILPIVGQEKNILFEEGSDGDDPKKLKAIKEFVVEPGTVLQLQPDAIHCIENPSPQPSKAFHVYGGNFKTLDEERDLWEWTTQAKLPFSLQGVVKESVARMAASQNDDGLDAIAKAIPKLQPMVEQIKSNAAASKASAAQQ
mmetsp:Transcript_61789/g.151143  ORF Transcript_61789/g.151143 Transcript_61789/m.151143 type:complete len:243 (-) Transcript_61789:114-842(-)